MRTCATEGAVIKPGVGETEVAILRGMWLGLCIAAPVGPIGVLVLKQAVVWPSDIVRYPSGCRGSPGIVFPKSKAGGAAQAGTATTSLTILSFAAMIASTGATFPYALVAGVFLGSMLWWTMLSFAADRLRILIQFRASLLNQIAAVSLGSFGVWAIAMHVRP